MKFFLRLIRFLTAGWLRGRRARRLLTCGAYVLKVDLLPLAHEAMGIGGEAGLVASGEDWCLRKVLPSLLENGRHTETWLFDVGANRGHYTRCLRDAFPVARLCAFEPNPEAFRSLQQVCADCGAEAVNLGLSEKEEELLLEVPESQPDSSHGTLYGAVFDDVHATGGKRISYHVRLRDMDGFLRDKGMDVPAFIKMDTEGHEMAVLKGAAKTLRSGRVRAIQFEFNEMNVISRVFLRDFYGVLGEQYEFFRLAPRQLVPLDGYETRNEIFQFQNILAVQRSLSKSQTFRAHIRV